MSNLNEDILNQIRLINYDRSKILSEQDGLPRSVSDFFENIGRWIEDKTMTNQEAQEWGKENLSFLDDLDFSDPDLAIDAISILIGLVPGLGTLGSAIIDVLHGISYWIRIPFQSDLKEQIKYFMIGLVQIILAFDPTGAYGNVLMKTFRSKIDDVVKMTPCGVLKLMGFSCINLTKGKINWWKIFLVWGVRMLFNQSLDYLASILSKVLNEFKNNVKKICDWDWPFYVKVLIAPNLKYMCEFLDSSISVFEENLNRLETFSQEVKEYEEELKVSTEYVKKKCLAIKKWDMSKNKSSVSTIQQFLYDLGHNIKVDGSFGNATSNAIGTFVYGAKAGINTTYKLWAKMKEDGWDVGNKSGYGPKMSKELTFMLNKIINSLRSNYTCSDLTI